VRYIKYFTYKVIPEKSLNGWESIITLNVEVNITHSIDLYLIFNFPILVLCTFGYIKLRSRKLIIEVNKKNQREFIYTRNNEQLLTEFEKVKIFYLKSLKGKIGLASYTLLVCG